MSTIPKRAPPKREAPIPRASDHEHVGRISTQTTIFAVTLTLLYDEPTLEAWAGR
jgi:hypothetical protein